MWGTQRKSLDPVEAHRKERAREVGERAAILGAILTFIAVVLEWKWGSIAVCIGDFIATIGCLTSYFRFQYLKRKRPEAEFPWFPGWISLFILGFPLVYTSGGINSPYLDVYLAVLFVGGTIAQSTVSAIGVGLFCVAELAFWFLVSHFTHWVSEPFQYSIYFQLTKQVMLLWALVLGISAFLKTEERLSKSAIEQDLALLEAETQLTQTAKMAEIGDLLAGTAHELAQPIQVISASASILNRMVEKKNYDQSILVPIYQRLAEASARMVNLLEQLRNFARKDTFQTKTFDLRESVHAVELLVRTDFATKDVHFETRLPDSSVMVDGDSLRIQQILLNLVNNARDAALKTSEDCPRVTMALSQREDWARISVENNGPGISLENQAKIFNPYFTTKERGKGTGLGLSICAQLVEQHRGRIYFSTEPEKTVFVVDVPNAKAQITDARPGLLVKSERTLRQRRTEI